MEVNQHGKIFRSNPEVFALGSTLTIKPDFIAQARQMSAPYVYEMDIVVSGSLTAGDGAALGRDAAKLIDTVRFRDSDDVLNISGAALRVLEQYEIGEKQRDPANVNASATNANYSFRLRHFFAPPSRAYRKGADTALPISSILDGGELSLTLAPALPTNFSAFTGQIRVYCYIVDERVRELKSRRRVKEEAISSTEYDYQVNGSLRSAFITSKLATTGYTSLAGIANLNSRSLEWPAALASSELLDEYLVTAPSINANDEFLLSSPGALPILVANDSQMIGRMPDLKSLHLDLLGAPPANARLVTDVIIDRNGDYAALSMGYPDPGVLAADIQSRGHVNGGNGRKYPVREMPRSLSRKLPIRID